MENRWCKREKKLLDRAAIISDNVFGLYVDFDWTTGKLNPDMTKRGWLNNTARADEIFGDASTKTRTLALQTLVGSINSTKVANTRDPLILLRCQPHFDLVSASAIVNGTYMTVRYGMFAYSRIDATP